MRIGIDLGGTKIEAIALGADGTELFRHRIPTPVADYGATLKAIQDLVATVENRLGGSGTVGIGTPGAISAQTGRMKNSNSIVLNDQPLDQDLSHLLNRPIRMENDANCFALSEAVDGAGQGHGVVFGVILGTGVGGGVVIDGRVWAGRNRIGGEWGHMPLPWPTTHDLRGAECYCGRRSCMETWLSGAGIVRSYQFLTKQILSAQQVFDAARTGDEAAVECVQRYVDRLARGLAVVADILDPDIIVLGGGISNEDLIFDGLAPLLSRYAFSDGIDTPIHRARHGDSSGVRGAAWLWPGNG